MAQTMQAIMIQEGDVIEYTPTVAVHAGDVYQLGSLIGVACESISAGELGHLAVSGIFDIVKKDEAGFTIGDLVYWQANGDPHDGDAGTGASTVTAGTLKRLGWIVETKAQSTNTCKVLLSGVITPTRTVWEPCARYIADPGHGGTFGVTESGICLMTSAAAETRLLPVPTFVGQIMAFVHAVDGGSIEITVASAFNQSAHTVATFHEAGNTLVLIGSRTSNAVRCWRLLGVDDVNQA